MKQNSYCVATIMDERTLKRRMEQAKAWREKCEERKRLQALARTNIHAWRTEMMRKLKGKTA